jgi:hypothetical protein
MTNDKMTDCGYALLLISDLSRRDCRTQPGVLTPGNDRNVTRPHKALRSRPRRRPRPRIRPRGVMECWSLGVLRQVRIAPALRVGDGERAKDIRLAIRASDHNPGLKPRAESCRPFGTNSNGSLLDLATRSRPFRAAHKIVQRRAAQ